MSSTALTTQRVKNTQTPWNNTSVYRKLLTSPVQTFYPGALLGYITSGSNAGLVDKLYDTNGPSGNAGGTMEFCGIVGDSKEIILTSTSLISDPNPLVQCDRPQFAQFSIASASAATDIGKPVYALWDDYVAYTGTLNEYLVGWVDEVINSTTVKVLLNKLTSTGTAQSLPSSLAFPRNVIDGGDFTTNPFQRGTSFTSIANTLTYTADRWFAVGGSSSSISVSQQAQTDVPGFGYSLRWGRANTNTATIYLGQVLETLDCIRLQGQQVTLSFWAKAGAQFSGTGLVVQLNHSTTAGNDTAAHLVAASTNWQATPTIVNATQTLSTTAVRYEFTGTVPATATQLGLLLSYTPTGTSDTTDYIDFYGFQLEVGPAATVFEHRDVEMELALCQRFFYQINEPGSGVIVGPGMITASAVQQYILPMPTQMISAPTVTVSAGTFKVNLAGTATAPTTFAAGSRIT